MVFIVTIADNNNTEYAIHLPGINTVEKAVKHFNEYPGKFYSIGQGIVINLDFVIQLVREK